ncbi:MAG: hypothetical protein ACE5HS_17770 [bacterium]
MRKNIQFKNEVYRQTTNRIRRSWGYFFMLAVLFSFTRCSFDKPSAPSWEVEVAIPLVSKVYTMSEIADDEEAIKLDNNGGLYFEETSELDAYTVGDQLNMEEKQDNFTLDLGSFTVDSPGSENTFVELREIYSQAENLHGQIVVVGAFSFATNKKTLDAYDGFSYAMIDSGKIQIQVANQLVIPLGAPLIVELWDAISDTLITSSGDVGQILPGQSDQLILDLNSKKISNQLAIRLRGNSPGSDGKDVYIDAYSNFEVMAEISEIEAREALAEIPQQIVSNHDNITVTDSLVIMEARVEQGSIVLDLGGKLPIDAWVIYELPDFQTPSGFSLKDSSFVRRNTHENIVIDLSGYYLKPQLANFGEQMIRYHWTIRTIDTGNEQVLVRATDDVNTQLHVTEVSFSSVTGKIGNQEIEVNQEEIDFEIPADLDSIFFETAELELKLHNAINFPAHIRFVIEGRNDAGATSYLNVNADLQPALQPSSPVTTVIVLNSQNSNINDFISILPSTIRIDGKVTIRDDNWVGTVSSKDFVDGEVRVSAPIALKLPPQTVDSDVNELEIEDDVKKDIIENLSSGTFYAEISNHLPLGASVEILFCQKDSTLFTSPNLRIGPLQADAAQVNGSGYVDQAMDGVITFSLTEEEMRTFLMTPLYSGVRVNLEGTDGQYVKVRASDYLQIKSYSKIKIKVNQD